ncbi:hypothetical protein [Aidingimonas lacisalsi]|uniref:hypothetical protein n=1 Tax=Aidingimonas lacisalsi TaxID=2604086 RepID=UPI0011D18AEB|nr:hypothetical protein [Aidingimonas lacisalsi]
MIRHWVDKRWYGALGVVVVLGGVGQPTDGRAATTDVSALADSRQLSDDELAGMRGRFIDGKSVMFFGVSMESEFRTAGGDSLKAGANLHADLIKGKASFKPHITATSIDSDKVTAKGNNNANLSYNDLGSGNARGVVQTIQAAGDGNAAANEFELDIQTFANAARGGRVSGNGETSLNTGTANLRVRQNGRGMEVGIDVPGQGRIKQQLRSGQGLHQSVQLNSDLQQVRNVTRLQVGVKQALGNASGSQLKRALDSARGLRR